MKDFVAKDRYQKAPFCNWNRTKKSRVYAKILHILKKRVTAGFAIAVPTLEFERVRESSSEEVIPQLAQFPYTFAVQSCMGLVRNWRERNNVTDPMQFIFDQMPEGKGEVAHMWSRDVLTNEVENLYWLQKMGYAFQDKAVFKPLQVADILAWSVLTHTRDVISPWHDPRPYGRTRPQAPHRTVGSRCTRHFPALPAP